MKNGGSTIYDFLQETLCEKKRGQARNCSEHNLYFTSCTKALVQHPRFFKFTFLRHPFPRAVSGWAMATRGATGRKVPFNEWAINTSSMLTKIIPMHWLPQASFVMTGASTCPTYDFAGTLGRTFVSDFEAALDRIDPKRTGPLWEGYRRRGLPHSNKADGDTTQRVLGEMSVGAKAALMQRYQVDFELFGFDPCNWE
jgi:hypothetical protein